MLLERASTLVQDDADARLLDCDCETYNCHCRKQCFCKLISKPFSGNPVPPPPVRTAEDGGQSPAVPDHQFKCSCSFDGVGGGGLGKGGSMDCDCKIADCTCEKRCVCRAKVDTAAGESAEGGTATSRRGRLFRFHAVDAEDDSEGGAAEESASPDASNVLHTDAGSTPTWR